MFMYMYMYMYLDSFDFLVEGLSQISESVVDHWFIFHDPEGRNT